MYPVFKDLPPEWPPVTLVIPYKDGEVFNPIHACANDEVLVVKGGPSIGHARIEGARRAKNQWVVQMDADAEYPVDYVLRVKEWIRRLGDRHPVLSATRTGGFGETFTRVYEHSLIVRKDEFLRRTRDYPRNVRWRGTRTDVEPLFRDAVKVPVKYYHRLTKMEKQGILLGGLALLTVPAALRR